MALTITSPAFQDGAAIPSQYTCEGNDISPPLEWSGVPAGARSLALLCDDPDAPRKTWVHWVLWAIPPDRTSLPEGLPAKAALKGVGSQGKNDFGRLGYGGPCPPPGKPHRYFFKLFALDCEVNLGAGAGKRELEQSMQGHVLAQGQLVGKFHR